MRCSKVDILPLIHNAALTGNLDRSVKFSECSALFELIPAHQSRPRKFQAAQYLSCQSNNQMLLAQILDLEC